jgi:hypothetical protein
MAKPKGATSYRLSEDAQRLITTLADRLGVSKTGVLEIAVRKLAGSELGAESSVPDEHPGRQAQPRSVRDPHTLPV